ncbi:MAG: NAD(+) synthase [Anaerolineae bacterium]|nr:NAD(+) synthase [Anaerolineae bacterium]
MSASSAVSSRAMLGFVRVAAITPELRVAEVAFNTAAIIAAMRRAADAGCQVLVFPEMSITGYTCGDLYLQSALIERASAALIEINQQAGQFDICVVVGLPIRHKGRLYNCAAFVDGLVRGVVPKSYLPNNNEFYEQRWYASALHLPMGAGERLNGGLSGVPFGTDLLFRADNMPDCTLGIEICEDVWAVNPPSGDMALAGATILLNPSASPDQLGKSDYRRELVRQQSARCLAAYVYSASGPGESSTDVVFGGHSMVAENGSLLAEAPRFQFDTQIVAADLDLQRLAHERQNNSSFAQVTSPRTFRDIRFSLPKTDAPSAKIVSRFIPRTPFVPSDPTQRAKNCEEIFTIQATGLMKRLRHTRASRVVIGISGGLDSTLALLATIRAFDRLGLPRDGITAITMPGFGTTSRTYDNALSLMRLLGVTMREIPIRDAVRQHFRDIGHDENKHDVTYENAQARERTQILMDVSNAIGGFVVGTGDLSEAALGWMTFNGDHMSMYHVNVGVPKTLVKYMIEWCAESEFAAPRDAAISAVLHDIIATPITPELLPLDKQGGLQQETEKTVGPYELHDFFLFYAVRYGFSPRKVYALAQQAFAAGGVNYPNADILRWLRVFYSRFFSQQFKRSAMPDGPKVGSVALSPRGDWRMPSDASAGVWLAELDNLS